MPEEKDHAETKKAGRSEQDVESEDPLCGPRHGMGGSDDLDGRPRVRAPATRDPAGGAREDAGKGAEPHGPAGRLPGAEAGGLEGAADDRARRDQAGDGAAGEPQAALRQPEREAGGLRAAAVPRPQGEAGRDARAPSRPSSRAPAL